MITDPADRDRSVFHRITLPRGMRRGDMDADEQAVYVFGYAAVANAFTREQAERRAAILLGWNGQPRHVVAVLETYLRERAKKELT